MKIEKILAGIREAQSVEKTAAVASPPPAAPTSAPREALMSALNDALNSSEKVAAEHNAPVADVMKVASEIAAAEQVAAVKEAQLLGAAFADAAVARVAEWQKVAAHMAPPPAVDTFGKFAAENPALVQQAASQGYAETQAHLEKMAGDAYVQGFNDTVVAIHKTAALEFMKAAAMTGRVLDTLEAQG